MTTHQQQPQEDIGNARMNRKNDNERIRRTNHDCVCEHRRRHVLLLLILLMMFMLTTTIHGTTTKTTTTTFSSSYHPNSREQWQRRLRQRRRHYQKQHEHQRNIIAFRSIRKPLSLSILTRRQRQQQKLLFFYDDTATTASSSSNNSPLLYMFLGGSALNRKNRGDDKKNNDGSGDDIMTDQKNVVTTTTITENDATTPENLVIRPTEMIHDTNMIKVNGENTNEGVFETDENDRDVDPHITSSSNSTSLSSLTINEECSSNDPSSTTKSTGSNPSRRSSLFWNSKQDDEETLLIPQQEMLSEEEDGGTKEEDETNKEDRATRTKRRRQLVFLGRKRALKKMLRDAREEKKLLKQQQQMAEEEEEANIDVNEMLDVNYTTTKDDTPTETTAKGKEKENGTQTKSIKANNNENQLVNITNIDELHQAVLVDGVEIKNLVYLPKGHAVAAEDASTEDIMTTNPVNYPAVVDDNVVSDESTTNSAGTAMVVEETLHPVLELISKRYQEGSIPGHRSPDDKSILAMSIEGGGMRGAVSAGMASAIACLGLADTFDEIYGSSAGSIVGAYFVSRQMCIDVYTEILPLASTQFVCKKRLMGNLVYQLSKDVASKASTNVKYYLNRNTKKKAKSDKIILNNKEKANDDNRDDNPNVLENNDIVSTSSTTATPNGSYQEEFDNYSELYENVFQLSSSDDEEETTPKRWKKGGRLRRLIGLGRRRVDTDNDNNDDTNKEDELSIRNNEDDIDDDEDEEPSWIHEAAEEVAAEELMAEEEEARSAETSSSSSSSSSSSTNSFWGFSSLVSRLGSVMKPVTSPLKYVSSTPGMNITFVLDGIMCSNSQGLRPLDLEVFKHNHQYQPLRVIASGVSTQTNQMVTAVLGLQDSDFFDSTQQVTFCSLTKRRGLFACLAASMSVPGATGAPIYLNQPSIRSDNNNGKGDENDNDTQSSTTTTDILKCFDAFCYEPMPYRSAVYPPSNKRQAATHVLVLRTRPSGCDVATKPTLYERVIAPLYFRQHDMPQVANYFVTGGQQYRYLEDVLTLDKGLSTKDKVPIPPTDIVVGIGDNDDDEKEESMSSSSTSNSVNEEEKTSSVINKDDEHAKEKQSSTPLNLKDPSTWRTAYMYPLTLPHTSVELSTVSTDQQEVLEAVRDGFTVAFELLAPIVGVNLTNFAIMEDDLELEEKEEAMEDITDNETVRLEANVTKNATTATDVARQIAELVFPDTSNTMSNDDEEEEIIDEAEINDNIDVEKDDDNDNKKKKKNAATAALLWEHLEPLHVQGELISVPPPPPSKPSLLLAVMGNDDDSASAVANNNQALLKKELLEEEDDEETQLLQQWWTSGGGTSPPQSLFKVGRWLDSMTKNRRRTDRTHLRKKLMHPKRMIQVAKRNFKYMHPRDKLLLGIGGIVSLASLRELQRQYLLNDDDSTSDMDESLLLQEAISDENSNQTYESKDEKEELLLLDSLISDSLQVQNVAATTTTNQEPIPLSKESLLTYLPGLREGKLSHLSKHLRDV